MYKKLSVNDKMINVHNKNNNFLIKVLTNNYIIGYNNNIIF